MVFYEITDVDEMVRLPFYCISFFPRVLILSKPVRLLICLDCNFPFHHLESSSRILKLVISRDVSSYWRGSLVTPIPKVQKIVDDQFEVFW